MTEEIIRGSITWDLPESILFTPGTTIPVTVTITNPTDEMRMYVLFWSMIQNGALVSAGLIEIEDVEDWFIDADESQEISFEFTPTITDAYLNISLLAGITEEEMEEDVVEEIIDSLTTYLYSVAVSPLAVQAQWLSTVMITLAVVGGVIAILPKIIGAVKEKE